MRTIFVDPELERRFRHYGFVVAPLLDHQAVEELLRFFDASSTPKLAGFHGTMYHNDIEYRRRVDQAIRPAIAKALPKLLHRYRPSVCNFMVKEPNDAAGEMPLHQDWSFVREPEDLAVHVWCPLVDVDHENGCLAVVPGTQHLSDPIRAFADDCPFRERFDLLRERFLIELPMKAGEAVLFDGRLVHSSPPNNSQSRRITAQAISIPEESPLFHSWRIAPHEVHTYKVDDEFFFKYVLHQAPTGIEPADVTDYTVRQLTADEINTLEQYQEGAFELAGAR